MRKVVLTVSSAKVVNTNLSRAYGNKKKYRETLGHDGLPTLSLNDMDNIIHKNHIINALHVMFGARPVSFKYGDRSKLSQKIVDIVNGGIISFNNIFKGDITFKNGDVKTVFYDEFTQGKKSAKNSNRMGLITTASNGEEMYAHFTWSSLYKCAIYKNSYKKVIDIINEYADFIKCNDITKKYTLIDVLTKIKYENPEWIEKFQDSTIEISPIINFLIDSNKKPGDGFNKIDSPNLAGLGNINAPTPKVTINATIILFMEDEDVERIINGKRCATILDNGFIYIDSTSDNIGDFNIINNVEDYIEDYIDDGFIEIKNLPYTNGTTKN